MPLPTPWRAKPADGPSKTSLGLPPTGFRQRNGLLPSAPSTILGLPDWPVLKCSCLAASGCSVTPSGRRYISNVYLRNSLMPGTHPHGGDPQAPESPSFSDECACEVMLANIQTALDRNMDDALTSDGGCE